MVNKDEYKFWHNQDTMYNFRVQLQEIRSRSEVMYEKVKLL